MSQLPQAAQVQAAPPGTKVAKAAAEGRRLAGQVGDATGLHWCRWSRTQSTGTILANARGIGGAAATRPQNATPWVSWCRTPIWDRRRDGHAFAGQDVGAVPVTRRGLLLHERTPVAVAPGCQARPAALRRRRRPVPPIGPQSKAAFVRSVLVASQADTLLGCGAVSISRRVTLLTVLQGRWHSASTGLLVCAVVGRTNRGALSGRRGCLAWRVAPRGRGARRSVRRLACGLPVQAAERTIEVTYQDLLCSPAKTRCFRR